MNFSLVLPVDFNTVIMFLCALILFFVHRNKLPTAILTYTFLFSAFAFILLDNFRDRTSFYEKTQLFTIYDSIGALLLLPLLYSYFFLLLQPNYLSRRRILITYLPTVTLIIAYILVIIFKGKLPPIRDFQELQPYAFSPEMIIRYILRFGVLLQSLVFTGMILNLYNTHRKELKDNFSYTLGSSLKALPWIVGTISIYGISLFIVAFKPNPIIRYLPVIILAVMPIVMTLIAVRQKAIYEKQDDEVPAQKQPKKENVIRNGQLDLLKNKLIELLEKDEIYRDPELSLDKVCRTLGTNRNYLYLVIKQDLNTSFYDLINSYRLNHAIDLLKDKSYTHLKIVDISDMVGYKNVSTFITGFKKNYGTTPNEFRNNQN